MSALRRANAAEFAFLNQFRTGSLRCTDGFANGGSEVCQCKIGVLLQKLANFHRRFHRRFYRSFPLTRLLQRELDPEACRLMPELGSGDGIILAQRRSDAEIEHP